MSYQRPGHTERISWTPDGLQPDAGSYSSVSADGRYVAFYTPASNLVPDDTNGVFDVFVRDRFTGTVERVSVASDGTQGNDASVWPSISADGRYVAFYTPASNLVPGDTNGEFDVFVRDMKTGVVDRVSVASDGTQGNGASVWPSISGDGRYVAFHSFASNLVPGDTNQTWDVFVHDRVTGATERMSVASGGAEVFGISLSPVISASP